MKIPRVIFLAALVLAFLSPVASAQKPVSMPHPEDSVRLIGGLPPVSDPAAIAISQTREWQQYAETLNNWWTSRPLPQMQKVTTWARAELGSSYISNAPAFYFFSGPDFLYLEALFPNASTYVMCAKEPVGKIPDPSTIPPQNLTANFDNLQRSLQTLFNFSYFITEDMKKDLHNTELIGVAPVLYVLLARTGKTVVKVQPIALTPEGTLRNDSPLAPQGIRIDFVSGPAAPRQSLYYFSGDLSNAGLKANPGVLKFCSRLGMGAGFLKADSYLVHMNEFSICRDFLLDHCKTIVQDDSGIPIRYFDPQTWNVRFYGGHVGPLDIFRQHYQKELAERYAVSNPKPLDFGMGYRFKPEECSLMVAFRKTGAAPQNPPSSP